MDYEYRAAKTPLIDLLRKVPKDGRHMYDESPVMAHNIPYGRLCHEAADELAAANERIEELSFDAAMANQAREIGNHFGLTYMQVWSDTSIASQVIDKMKEQQATIAQQAEQLAAAERDAERYRWLRSNHPIHDNSPFICRNFGAAFSQWTDDQADKAIDAAIAASREGD